MRVGVDQTWEDQVSLGIEDADGICAALDLLSISDGLDNVALDENSTVINHPPLWIQGDKGAVRHNHISQSHLPLMMTICR